MTTGSIGRALAAAILSLGAHSAVSFAGGAFPGLSLCGPPPPGEIYPVQFMKAAGNVARIVYYPQWGYYADIVRGSLISLAATHGDFSVATGQCVLEDRESSGWTTFDDPAVPPAGDGYWYLIRADQYSGCTQGEGTYNSRQGHQVGDRNVGIQTSGRDCTCYYSYGGGPCTVLDP